MAPATLASANIAYEKALSKLKQACVSLDYHIPPSPDAEDIPPLQTGQGSELIALHLAQYVQHGCRNCPQRTVKVWCARIRIKGQDKEMMMLGQTPVLREFVPEEKLLLDGAEGNSLRQA